MCNLNSKGDSTIKLLNLDLFYKGVFRFCVPNLSRFKMSAFNFPWIVLSKTKEKIGRFKSLKFTYEWRQQMWRHKLTFGVILSAILIGLMFCIFRPSLVGKELKQAKLFQINRNCHVLISPLGGGLAPPWMENSTSTALTYSLRVSFFTDIFPLKEIQTISNITDNLNYVAKQQNGNLFDGT